jgi:hypothetical protein
MGNVRIKAIFSRVNSSFFEDTGNPKFSRKKIDDVTLGSKEPAMQLFPFPSMSMDNPEHRKGLTDCDSEEMLKPVDFHLVLIFTIAVVLWQLSQNGIEIIFTPAILGGDTCLPLCCCAVQ